VKARGALLVLASAAGYGLLPLFATQVRDAGLDEVAVMALRFSLAAGALWTVVAARRPTRPPVRALAASLAFGGTCWSIQSVSYLLAVTHVGAPLAALLLYTYPLMVVTGAVLAGRQRWHRGLAAAFGLVLAGLALVFGNGASGGGADPAGVAAGLVAAATYAAFILLSEPVARRMDAFLFTALAMTGAACATGLFTLARGGVPGAALARAAVPLLGLALLSTVVPAVAFLLGLRHVGAARAAILSCAEVAVTCAAAWAVLGQRLTLPQLAGCVAILAGGTATQGVTPGARPVPRPIPCGTCRPGPPAGTCALRSCRAGPG
jgi:drug/metabolite transporter (DMT)-like permease